MIKKIILYFMLFGFPFLLIFGVYVSQKKYDAQYLLLAIRDANKTNYLHNGSRNFTLTGIKNFRFISHSENAFMVIYVPPKPMKVVATGDDTIQTGFVGKVKIKK